jgi:hypothetical protein
MELNGTDQLLVCAYGVHFLDSSINTIKENAETLFEANGDVGLEINTEKTVYDDVLSSELRTEPECKDS